MNFATYFSFKKRQLNFLEMILQPTYVLLFVAYSKIENIRLIISSILNDNFD
jgi:hypothetical protein